METFLKSCFVFFIFNQFFTSADTEVCNISTRSRRDAPYIISVGSCDPTNIKIIKPDGHEHGRHAEEDVVASASNVEEMVLEGRKTFYELITKVLEHMQARVDKRVQKVSRMVEEKKIASEVRGSSRKKRINELIDIFKFKNLHVKH